ncbi:hypothetical protein IC617_10945 [Neiella sp. HB171785]|uniref:Uncharacterized protein n=1 Tax=Neiella litorisoli TaxID=2771431 RepID=A0A8J6QHR8_9GAMM|nr:hypothetical protein [Neiella litorisoli]MBD1389945.1 hypothetical protein [Neiella litorisoli]
MMIVIEGDDNAIELEFHLIEQRMAPTVPQKLGTTAEVEAACQAGALLPDGFEAK